MGSNISFRAAPAVPKQGPPPRPPPGPEVKGRSEVDFPPWLFSLWCCGYEPRAQGVLIKGLALVLNSLLLERPAFISLAQQTTDAHRRLWLRTRLRSHTLDECVFVWFRPDPPRLVRMAAAVALSGLQGPF